MSNVDGGRAGRFSQGLHGGEIYRAAAAMGLQPRQILDFSGNSNIFARALTAKIIENSGDSWLHYPETDAAQLKKNTARYEGVDKDNIVMGNGASDLIWRFLRESAPRSILFIGPVFSEYARAAEALGISHETFTPPVESEFALGEGDLKRLWESSAELCVLCTPNNPGGITYENIAAILASLRVPRVLVDLSYREFLFGTHLYEENHWNSYSRMCAPGTNVFCLHSFTKFFCCPGVRLGYLVGEAMHLRSLNARTPAWNVGGQAQTAGLLFIDNVDEYKKTLHPLRSARHAMGVELRRMPVFCPDLVLEGPTFFCCGLSNNAPGAMFSRDGTRIRAGALQEFLLRHKILVRDCDNIPGMPRGFVRIQVRGEEDNEKLLYALSKA